MAVAMTTVVAIMGAETIAAGARMIIIGATGTAMGAMTTVVGTMAGVTIAAMTGAGTGISTAIPIG
jgi:hypothetical protein